jgi:hypothetical protein
MATFSQWLINLFRNALTWLYNTGIDLLQALFDGFIDFAVGIVTMFPASEPVPTPTDNVYGPVLDFFLTALNWLFPVAYIVSVCAFLVSGMLAYFIIAPLARWAKLLT